MSAETEVRPPQPVWAGELLPAKRFPWLPVMLIGALTSIAAVIAVVVLSGSRPAEQAKIDPPKEPALAPPKPADPPPPEPPKHEPPPEIEKKTPVVAQPPPSKKPPPKKPAVGSGPASPVVKPAVKPGMCPDGSPVASHWDGRCPTKK
jgi:hypothetical protein